MKSIRCILLIALLQAVTISPLFAADDLDRIKSSGVFRIGTEGTYAPFTYHDEMGKLTGFDVEIGTAIAKRLGAKPQFIEGQWDGLIAGLDVNRYDVVINVVSITEARKAKYDYSDPYITSYPALIVASSNSRIRSFGDLKGRKSANSLTSHFGAVASAYGAQVIPVQGFNEALDLLISGRVDATVNDSLSFFYFIKRRPDAHVKIVAFDNAPGSTDESGVLMRKGSPRLRAAINAALAGMRKDGTYQKISQKYFGEDVLH
ncbi:cystine transport system substrate-binding protein [Paraburkholderia sp. GAS333]|uniref:amino acid ABC transporter substrate-binding protein n=1 Tax=Paraburkholderia sp. GAS333 TaxID=3156279 RepID=UPI003D222D8F